MAIQFEIYCRRQLDGLAPIERGKYCETEIFGDFIDVFPSAITNCDHVFVATASQ